MGVSSPFSATSARATGLIGAYGSSLSSPPRTTGSASSSSPISSRAIRVLAWPRSPRKTRSCPARIAFSTDGRTVSSKPTTPGKIASPSPSRVRRLDRSSSLTVRLRQPEARSSPRVFGRLTLDDLARGGDIEASVGIRGNGGGGTVAVDRRADLVDARDAGGGESGEIVAPALVLDL